MSSKKMTVETKGKAALNRKNRRRSARKASNGEVEDVKAKRIRDSKDENDLYSQNNDEDVYKDIIDLVPPADLNCAPSECPASPGTRVNLHGVILHETQGGLIVLNIRWRNKIFSGALIDIDKNKWSSERIPMDPTPLTDGKPFHVPPPPVKKIKISIANDGDSDSSSSRKKNATSPTTPSKNTKIARGNGKKRGSQDNSDGVPSNRSKSKVGYANGSENAYECPEPNCGKKYKNKNGLSYHQKTVHAKNESSEGSGKENKSESPEESDSGDDHFVIDEKVDEESKEEEIVEALVNAAIVNPEATLPPAVIEEKDEILQSAEESQMETEKPLTIESIKQENVEDEDVKEEQVEVKTEVDVECEIKDRPMDSEKESVIIYEEDHVASFKELFAPAQHYNQFSPTLTNLNPQKFNESLSQVVAMAAPSKTDSLEKYPSIAVSEGKRYQMSSNYTVPSLIDYNDVVGESDNEEMTVPLILVDCEQTYPQDHRDAPQQVVPVPAGFSMVDMHAKKMYQQASKSFFEKTLLYKELSNKPPSVGFHPHLPTPPPTKLLQDHQKLLQDLSHFDSNNIPSHLMGYMQPPLHASVKSPTESKDDGKPTLLEQRLLSTDANKMTFPSTLQSPNFEKNVTEKSSLIPVTPTSILDYKAQQRMRHYYDDSSKIKTIEWIPEKESSPKQYNEFFKSPPLTSSFRMHTSKTITPATSENKIKRAGQPIPIAPAPLPVMQQQRDMISSPIESERTHMSRFTLTNDRLIHNPIENRGRPRKFRAEKEVEMKMSRPDSLSRKHAQSPAVRTSVIQGATHGADELVKLPERSPEIHPMFQHGRFEGSVQERERLIAHAQEMKVNEMRVDRYKVISSPPRMFVSPRSILSPPLSRAPSHSPREVRSSPGLNADISKTQNMSRERIDKLSPSMYERARTKQETTRAFTPDHTRAKFAHESMMYSRAIEMEKERLAAEYQRFPPSHQRAFYEHHRGLDDNEQARLRERFLHQTGLSQTGIYRASPPSPHPSTQTSRPSTNLVLTRADGAIIGPLPYENRGEHKR